MASTLHITNGDSAVGGMRAGGIGGEIVPWRDTLHEGPVPAGLTLAELSRVRAKWLADQGLGKVETIEKDFSERDDMLRRYTDFDEVVLWFEWDLYDQLQLIQILDFLADSTKDERAETSTRLSIVSFAGYLGTISSDRYADLHEKRRELTDEMLQTGRRAWNAFRSSDPRDFEKFARERPSYLEFLEHSIWRQLEELPSTRNGLSRSESQILESVSQGPLSFHEIFKRVATREERVFCGDAMLALYIERMSLGQTPLITYTTGERIDAPRTEEDSRAFRNAEMGLTVTGRDVLVGDEDWIYIGGSDRWLGGAHIAARESPWRWDSEERRVIATNGKGA